MLEAVYYPCHIYWIERHIWFSSITIDCTHKPDIAAIRAINQTDTQCSKSSHTALWSTRQTLFHKTLCWPKRHYVDPKDIMLTQKTLRWPKRHYVDPKDIMLTQNTLCWSKRHYVDLKDIMLIHNALCWSKRHYLDPQCIMLCWYTRQLYWQTRHISFYYMEQWNIFIHHFCINLEDNLWSPRPTQFCS